MNIKRIGVTGANGHVGASLIRILIEKGYSVSALINKNDNAIQNLPLEIFQGNISKPNSLISFCENQDVVIHCAGFIGLESKFEKQNISINVIGTQHMVNTCLKTNVKKLVHISSLQAYKTSNNSLDETATPADKYCDSYSYSKQLGEIEVRKGIARGLNATIVNPTGILGPFDYNKGSQTRALLNIANRSVPALIKGGFDWVDVRDVAEGIIGAMLKGENGANYLLSGHWKSFQEVASKIAEYTKQKPISLFVPIELAQVGAVFEELISKISGKAPLFTREALKLVKNAPSKVSHQQAEKVLNYQPRPFSETITETLKWMVEQNWIKHLNKE